jgi:hypothetical protein
MVLQLQDPEERLRAVDLVAQHLVALTRASQSNLREPAQEILPPVASRSQQSIVPSSKRQRVTFESESETRESYPNLAPNASVKGYNV